MGLVPESLNLGAASSQPVPPGDPLAQAQPSRLPWMPSRLNNDWPDDPVENLLLDISTPMPVEETCCFTT